MSDGTGTLLEKMGEFEAGVGTLKMGIDKLAQSADALTKGVGTIDSSAKSINSAIMALDNALNAAMTDEQKKAISNAAASQVSAQFAEGTDTYRYIYNQATTSFANTITGTSTVNAIYKGLYDNLYDTLYSAAVAQYAQSNNVDTATVVSYYGAQIKKNVEDNLMQLATGIAQGIATQGQSAVGQSVVEACEAAATQAAGQAAVTGAESAKAQIAGQIEAKQDNGYSLVTGAAALAAGTDELASNIPALTNGLSQLVSGAAELSDGSAQLTEGTRQLSEGATNLRDGINELNNDAIVRIVDAYNGDVKALVSRMEAVIEAATEYDTYTLAAEGDAAATKFIIKTAGIRAE